MQSIDWIRGHLRRSTERVLERIEDMREHGLVSPTPNGGGHTIWVLGHLAYVEGLVVPGFMLGRPNPLAEWEPLFDGDDVSTNPDDFPSFDEVLGHCRDMRASTVAILDTLSEDDLDQPGRKSPTGFDEIFGTYRHCLQYVADHWYMHRGQLADARRAAGRQRMWL
ncbi:MAG: DinB family protein [Planctomycetes bacterium]|nr:DinB family protein [Planctomycetota bacterium]